MTGDYHNKVDAVDNSDYAFEEMMVMVTVIMVMVKIMMVTVKKDDDW